MMSMSMRHASPLLNNRRHVLNHVSKVNLLSPTAAVVGNNGSGGMGDMVRFKSTSTKSKAAEGAANESNKKRLSTAGNDGKSAPNESGSSRTAAATTTIGALGQTVKKARSTSKPLPLMLSLDGTMMVVDDHIKKKRIERAKSMKDPAHHHGLGGAMIRAVWEQENDPDTLNLAPVPSFLKHPKTVSIVGAPMSWGQPLAGTDHGPVLVHQAGLIPALKRAGWRVNGEKNLEVLAPTAQQVAESERFAKETGALAHNCAAVGSFLKTLSEETEAVARRDEFVLTIGGDHSIACGSLAGILRARPDTGVIWVDAHADLHTPLTSESGNMHGMPVGILMAEDSLRCRIPGFEWLKNGPRLRPEKIVYVGARDLDQAERRKIKQMGILCFTMTDVDRWGIGQVMERAFKHLGNSPIHLSYDIDAVDAEFAPHTGTVVRGGFSYREANFIAESVAETNRLCSMDLVEINPTLGEPTKDNSHVNMTVQLGLTLIASAMGQRIL